MSIIKFHSLIKVPELKERKKLKQFLQRIARQEDERILHLSYIFCSDEKLLRINQDFLKHDFYTDIITFDMREQPGPVVGEVYISVDRVRDNANKHLVSNSNEMHRVIFHGLLHLCGYKDKLKADRLTMREKEDYYLKRYNT